LQENRSTHFLDAVKEQISAGIASSCNCSRVQLHEVRFYCSKYPNYVSVRGYIRGSEGYTADEMLQCMEIWRSKPSTAIVTDTKILNINIECKIDVLCWNETECQPPLRVQPCNCNCCSDRLNTTHVDRPTDLWFIQSYEFTFWCSIILAHGYSRSTGNFIIILSFWLNSRSQ
jgi:hypothetical protein